MPRASLQTLPPLLLRYILRWFSNREQLRTVGRLRCTYRGFASTLEAAPLDLYYDYDPTAFLTLAQARQWTQSAMYVLASLMVIHLPHPSHSVLFPCLKSFTTLRDLEVFSAYREESETVEATLPLMSMLTYLCVDNCTHFSDEHLGKQPALHHLDLMNSPALRGNDFASLPNVTALRVSDCPQFTGEGLVRLGRLQLLSVDQCPQFEYLGLRGRPPPPFATFVHLQSLCICDCPLIDIDALALLNLTSLEIARCANVTENSIGKQHKLRHLCVTDLAQYQGTTLSSFTNLTSLDMRGLANITDEAIATLRDVPCLQHLVIGQCGQFRGATLSSLTSLTSLDMEGFTAITADSLANLCHLTDLQRLNLDICPQLQDCVLARIAEITQLTSLRFIDSHHVTDEGIAHLRRLPCLQNLAIGWCWQLRGVTLPSLTNLTSLSLRACSRVTDDVMEQMAAVLSRNC